MNKLLKRKLEVLSILWKQIKISRFTIHLVDRFLNRQFHKIIKFFKFI